MARRKSFEQEFGRPIYPSAEFESDVVRAQKFPPAGVTVAQPSLWQRVETRVKGKKLVTEQHAVTDRLLEVGVIAAIGLGALYEWENIAGKLPADVAGFGDWLFHQGSNVVEAAGKATRLGNLEAGLKDLHKYLPEVEVG